MRKFFCLIIGFIAFIATASSASAAFCNPETPPDSIYGGIYCGLKMYGNEESDKEIFKTIAKQLQYDAGGLGADLIKLIIDNGSNISCAQIFQFMKENSLKDKDMPADIKGACMTSENGAESVQPWSNAINSIHTAYEKEKVLYYTKKNLDYEFKTSEKYWDGELRDIGDAPFDLVVDLNLIEIVLFGSKATWTSDVWKYPVKEGGEGEGEGGPPSGQPSGQPSGPQTGLQPEQPSNQSVTTEETVTPGTESNCVPADNPDADTGDNPESDYSNPACGNGTVEVLLGEQCDDGNTNSGDGCNQYCMTEQTGATQMCQDAEAVTFSKPKSQSGQSSSSQSSSQSEPQQEPQSECPPGTFPKKETTIKGPPPETPKYPEAPQSDSYPGPDVGGTMKEFPESKKPPCETGYSEVKISAAGKTASYCMPDSFACANPNDVRDALFPGWENDEELAKTAETIEATFCVKLVKANRPESPYNMNDGCIDCHITAMTDALTKALETNVSPLENTTGGFAISSRWGPKFSLNLITGIKATFKAAFTPDKTSEISKIQSAINKTTADNKPPTPAVAVDESAEDAARRKQAEQEAQATAAIDTIKNYQNSSQAISDQEFYSRVSPLLDQMLNIFTTIQGQYAGIADTSQLDKKDTCKF